VSWTRRGFLAAATLGAGAVTSPAASAGDGPDGLAAIDTMPNLCAHEHWGSLTSIGHTDVGFVADAVAGAASGETGLLDLLLDPYLGGFLACGGFDGNRAARELGCESLPEAIHQRPEGVLEALRPHLATQRSVGTLMCIATGVRELYGFDLDGLSAANWRELDAAIRRHYTDPFAWYREAMGRAHLTGPIRPVELSYMLEAADPALAAHERAFTHALLRVDGFIEWRRRPSDRVRYCIERTGIEPHDAASWRALLEATFALAQEHGCVGIKQLQAYSRDLEFAPHADGDIDLADDSPPAVRAFEDFTAHECCRLAHELSWPFQVHVGTANLPRSSPLPLEALAYRYPGVRFVLLHTWPYFDESAYLAHFLPNVYIDTCWLAILSPSFLEEALRKYIGFVPSHKLMCSQDATSIEMAVGSARHNRTLLRKVLGEQVRDGRFTKHQALEVARRALHDNARGVYGA